MPEIEWSRMRIVAGGNNQDVMVEAEFTAVRSPTYGNTFQIDKFVGP